MDFGCGSGAFLELMHLQGWRVVGLDISEEVVGRIRRELDLPALAGTLPHPQLPPGTVRRRDHVAFAWNTSTGRWTC